MQLTFDARLDGARIIARIGSDTDLPAPVWCLSLMAPGRVVAGGQMRRAVAGYCEVALPDLPAGTTHEVVLTHANPAFRPANRAWLPPGGYLRLADGTCHALPALPGGVAPAPERPAPAWDGLRLIPQPAGWAPAPGVLAARGFAAEGAALAAVDALSRRLGFGRFLDPAGAPLRLETDPALPPEGYRLTIAPDGVALAAADRAGTFNGAVTLLTLIRTHDGRLPCGTITDRPRFLWRGQHLDCARHFYRPDTILRLLDLMALLKLNRFHWHFADDEAFRLEVDRAPDLARKTAFRGEGCAVPGVFGGGIRAGGSYSRADVAAVLARAAELNIAVLPEIEVPAHAFALNAVIPGLRDADDTGAEISIQGYPRNVVNPALPATWDFLLPLAEEVAGLFPIGILHLGCDELPPGAWDGSPAVRALMAREGLAGRDDVQGWMMRRLAGHLAARGIRTAAWEEAAKGANGGIGTGALLFSWTGQGPGIAAARAGHDVVMCPAQHTYLDMAHSADPGDWGASWAAVIGLEDTVAWDPVPPEAPDIAPRVAGVQGCFWSEFTTDDRQMEAMIAPRILGIAVRAWEPAGVTGGPALRAIGAHYAPLFDTMGWDRHRGA